MKKDEKIDKGQGEERKMKGVMGVMEEPGEVRVAGRRGLII